MLLPRGSRESRHSPPGERRVPERSTCGRIDTSFLSTRLKRAPARAAIEASEAVLARRRPGRACCGGRNVRVVESL